jgi:uncharacterized protein (TIGR03435 family)
MTAIRFLALVLPFAGTAEAAEKPLTFDAASVKPATVPGGVTVFAHGVSASRREDLERLRRTGGPGTSDPDRNHYPLVSLKGLLDEAWEGSYSEIRSAEWLDTQVVSVDATMPPDTTKEQFQEMLRNLVTDRFQLQYHIETKEIPGYTLVVTRNGPKLKESAAVPDAQDEAAFNEMKRNGSTGPRRTGPDGFDLPPRGMTGTGFAAIAGNRARMMSQRETMEGFAHAVETVLKVPVADATGLTGKYDFTVTYSGGFGRDGPYASSLAPPSDGTTFEAQDPLPDIFSALQSQLGLKLEPRKVPVEVMVVDHMEKTPVGN